MKGNQNNLNILVTGANGYIGRHVVRKLLELGYCVTASDLEFTGVDHRAQLCHIPIFSGACDIYEQMGCPDRLIHLAWRNGFHHNMDTHITDLPAHYLFLKNMIEHGLKDISVMGSMHEVGYWEGKIDEHTPTNPLSLYGIAKNSLRQMLMVLTRGSEVCMRWLRAFYIYGEDEKNHSIFTKLLQASENGDEHFPMNSGAILYDFISVEYLAEQIAKAVLQTEERGIIHCCTGQGVSLKDKVEAFIKEQGIHIQLQYGAYPDRPYDSKGIWGDNEKIKRILERFKERQEKA